MSLISTIEIVQNAKVHSDMHMIVSSYVPRKTMSHPAGRKVQTRLSMNQRITEMFECQPTIFAGKSIILAIADTIDILESPP